MPLSCFGFLAYCGNSQHLVFPFSVVRAVDLVNSSYLKMSQAAALCLYVSLLESFFCQLDLETCSESDVVFNLGLSELVLQKDLYLNHYYPLSIFFFFPGC